MNKINNIWNTPFFRWWLQSLIINLLIHVIGLIVFHKVNPRFIIYSYIHLFLPTIYLCIFAMTHILTIIYTKLPIHPTFIIFCEQLPNLIEFPGWLRTPAAQSIFILIDGYHWSISLCGTLKLINMSTVHFSLVFLRYLLSVAGYSALAYTKVLLHAGFHFINLILSAYIYMNCIKCISFSFYSILPLMFTAYQLIAAFVNCINVTYKLLNYYDEMMKNKK